MTKKSWKLKLADWLISSHRKNNDSPDELEPDADVPYNTIGGTKISVARQHRGRIIDSEHESVHFTVHRASGGYVVETCFYDNRKDHNHRSLHIITSQEDFSDELGKAVFMELLKNR